jgi:hypothetical protein
MITKAQRIYLQADLWPSACATQGWIKNDRAKKLSVIGRILGREIESTNDIAGNAEFDAVKRELGFLADNLDATIETIQPERGRARRLKEKIREQMKCLGLYHPNPGGYVQTIVYDKFRHHGWGATYEQLSADGLPGESELDQLVMTLARTIQRKRKMVGDSLHDMYTKAGVPCFCKQCHSQRETEAQQPDQVDDLGTQKDVVPVFITGEEPF